MMVGSDVVIGWVKDSKGYITVRMKLYSYFSVIIVAVELMPLGYALEMPS